MKARHKADSLLEVVDMPLLFVLKLIFSLEAIGDDNDLRNLGKKQKERSYVLEKVEGSRGSRGRGGRGVDGS